MYNRYIPGSDGHSPVAPPSPTPSPQPEENRSILAPLLQRLRLTELDTSDLLLMAVIFLLFRESEDEELLLILALLLLL